MRWFLVPVFALVLSTLGIGTVGAIPPAADQSPRITGPVVGGDRGFAYNEWPWSLKPYGYRQDEYFVSGAARSVKTLTSAKFRTRIQVFRPTNAVRSTGTVKVEWNNVTAEAELTPDWVLHHRAAMKAGDTFVLASVQQVSVCGFAIPDPRILFRGESAEVLPTCSPMSLKAWDPRRYASLSHPGEEYAHDIFSQIIRAVRLPANRGVVTGGRAVERVIGLGDSQSAYELGAYLCDGSDRRAGVLDGAVVDSDLGFRRLNCNPRVPTIRIWNEEGGKPADARELANLATWMGAGHSHADNATIQIVGAILAFNLTGRVPMSAVQMQAVVADYGQNGIPFVSGASCLGGNYMPRYVLVNAAIEAVESWVRTGQKPAAMPRLKPAKGPTINDAITFPTQFPDALARDRFGNAIGGVRSPVIDVPVATYIGSTCSAMGQSFGFTQDRLKALYPTHQAYVDRFARSAQDAVTRGFVTFDDANYLLQGATNSHVGGNDTARAPRIANTSPYRTG